METSDLTVRILTEIRDEVRTTNQRLDQTNLRLDELRQHVVTTEIHLATAIADLKDTLHDVRDRFADRGTDELLAIWTSVTWALVRHGWRPHHATPELEGAILALRAVSAEIRELVQRG